jgi:hypothetical protein
VSDRPAGPGDQQIACADREFVQEILTDRPGDSLQDCMTPSDSRSTVAETTQNDALAQIRAAQAGDPDAYDALLASTVDRLQLFLRVRLGAALKGVDA